MFLAFADWLHGAEQTIPGSKWLFQSKSEESKISD